VLEYASDLKICIKEKQTKFKQKGRSYQEYKIDKINQHKFKAFLFTAIQ